MKELHWTPEESEAVLRAMRTVATVGGAQPLDAIAKQMIDTTREHVLHQTLEIDARTNISPSDAAAALQGRTSASAPCSSSC
jgi:hypothetical protein